MRSYYLPLVILLSSFSGTGFSDSKNEWLIIPGVSVGEITKTTSHHNLIQIYGRNNVVKGDVHIGEGQTVPATILFPVEPEKKLKIVWQDDGRMLPGFIRISGTRSKWKTKDGITLGTKLKDLERLNGASISFAGFDWDNGGSIRSYNNGALKQFSPWGDLGITLMPNREMEKAYRNHEIYGERSFESKDPRVQKLDPEIWLMEIYLKENFWHDYWSSPKN